MELTKEKSIMILLVDKGKLTVIMDTETYEQTVITMLSDDNTYEKLNKHPTTKYKKKLISIINKLKDEGKNVRPGIYVTSVKQKDHLVRNYKNTQKKKLKP